MAGLSSKAIKNKIKSMASTKQITKAMELVASSKLRSAQNKAVSSRPYFHALYEAMSEIVDSSPVFASPYLKNPSAGRSVWIVIAGDRGLAGGYNNNILKLAWSRMENDNPIVLPIGKKAVEFFHRRGAELLTERYAEAAAVSVGSCYTIANLLAEGFLAGKYKSIQLAYTNFTSMLSQQPATLELLPLTMHRQPSQRRQEILYESGSESVFNAIVPEYLGGLIYGAMCESIASEQAARRTAMDAASKNADEFISQLNLQYNRARQGAITQELTEIVAGSEQS
ncbi:MAG: ATP synthase F1 subunit gamma [Clostridia bacterium]|nr:ATP synthase F1 subunit gamma [Clostridia bacterium]